MNEMYSNILVEFFERMTSWENGIVEGREISLAQMHLLEVVGNHGSLRMKELSERLGVTTGTLTVMVHRLVSKGYLAREKDPEDGRSLLHHADRIRPAGVRQPPPYARAPDRRDHGSPRGSGEQQLLP